LLCSHYLGCKREERREKRERNSQEKEQDGVEESGEVWNWKDRWRRNLREGKVRSEHGNWRERCHEGARP